ncbi:MAG: DegT/DnrJ/EryC1/StrS family aminotransferase [Spirochaetota bacterium]
MPAVIKNTYTPALEGGSPVRDSFLPFSPPDITGKEINAVTRVLRSGWITRGPECRSFETMLAQYTGSAHAVVLNSATAGLFLTLKSLGIKQGDQVITTPYTFAATANVILHTGAQPVFADIQPPAFSIDPEQIEEKITKKTRAVLPVHFGGHPAPIDRINEIAASYGLHVVEDAAHALGAEYRGKKIGNGENPSVLSFHAVKNLTTAEGGAVMCNNPEVVRYVELHSLHGQTKDAYMKAQAGGWKYDIAAPGYKFNMTDIQAALGIEQLHRLEQNQNKRKHIAGSYTECLKKYDFVRTPAVSSDVVSSWHLYPVVIDFSRLKITRDGFIAALAKENISSNVHYIPVHMMSYYRDAFGYTPEDFPVSYTTYTNELSLPLYPQMNSKDTGDVLKALAKLFNYYKK